MTSWRGFLRLAMVVASVSSFACLGLVVGCDFMVDDECVNDADCPDGQVCQNGVCVAGVECITDGDCPDGQVCQNGVCVAGVDCTTDAECGDLQICENNQCVAVECLEDADCADGEVCSTDHECVAAPEPPEKPLHETLFTENFDDPSYKGTEDCLTCHSNHAADIMETAHWNWSGAVDDIAGLEGEDHGKVDLVNDY